MRVRPSSLIPAMLKAMTETVLPAVDPENQLAVEQARLVIGMLNLMAVRLPLLARYDRAELESQVALAARLAAVSRGGPATRAALESMAAAERAATAVLAAAGTDPGDLERRLLEIRGSIGAVVRALHEDGEAASRGAVDRAVVEAARIDVERARAWLLPQGWESAPADLPPLEELIAAPESASTAEGASR